MDVSLTESLLASATNVAAKTLPGACAADLPTRAYVDAADLANPYDLAAPMAARQDELFAAIAGLRGRATAIGMRRLGLAQLALRSVQSPRLARLPDAVQRLTLDWLARLAGDLIEKPLEWFDPDGADRLQAYGVVQDFAVAAGCALPVGGAWIVERRRMHERELFPSWTNAEAAPDAANPRILRRALLDVTSRVGLRAPLRALRRRVEEARGRFTDCYVIHTANRYRRHFTARHLETAYENIALLLSADPASAGIYRKSWFLDPDLQSIEPRLAFLTETPRRHAARFQRLGPVDASKREEILEFSATRRARIEARAYEPAEWAYLWRRDRVLEWAAARPGADTAAPRTSVPVRQAVSGP